MFIIVCSSPFVYRRLFSQIVQQTVLIVEQSQSSKFNLANWMASHGFSHLIKQSVTCETAGCLPAWITCQTPWTYRSVPCEYRASDQHSKTKILFFLRPSYRSIRTVSDCLAIREPASSSATQFNRAVLLSMYTDLMLFHVVLAKF